MKPNLKLLISLSTVSLVGKLSAQVNYGWNVATGDWNDPANWTNIAGIDNDRFVNNGGTAVITADTTLIIRDLKVGLGGGTTGFVNHSAGLASTGAGNWSFVGQDGGTGTYQLNAGAGAGILTGTAQGTGSYRAERLYVGGGSSGSIGLFQMNTSGTMTLPSDFVVGQGAGNRGTFNMDAGTVNSNGWSFVGTNGGTGTMRMSGGTFAPNNRLYVGGGGGTGKLELSGNAIVTTGDLKIGDNQDINATAGVGTLDVSGNAVITSTGHTQVGRLGSVGHVNQTGGTVNVNGGWFGIANDSPASAGSDYTSTGGVLNLNNNVNAEVGADTAGSLNVGGTGVVNGSNLIIIGFRNGGNGTLNMTGSGVVNATNGVQVGVNGGSTGTVNMDGGTIVAPSISRLAGTAQLNFNGGTFKATSAQSEFLPGFDATNSEVKAGGAKIDTNGVDIATGVALDGVGALTKLGAGKLTLNGVTTHGGGTFVTAGTLALSATGNLTGAGVIDVSSGATLDVTGSAFALAAGQSLTGDGSVVGNTTLTAGILAPGAGIASLDFSGDLALGSGLVSNFQIQKSGLSLTGDLAAATGALTLGGTLNVTSLGGTFAFGDTWNLFDGATISGSFAAVNLPGGAASWNTSNLGTLGTITFIPEPAGTALALGSLALLGARRRRRDQA